MISTALTLLLLTVAQPAAAAPTPAPAVCKAYLSPQDLIDRLPELLQTNRIVAAKEAQPNPRAERAAASTALASQSTSPATSPTLTQFLALAFEKKTVPLDTPGQVNVSLNGQTLVQLLSPKSIDDTKTYQKLRWLRRLGGKVTLGGKGDALDQDGDGKPDDPLEAKQLSDSVAWDIQYRFIGTRDRRDSQPASAIFDKLRARQTEDALLTYRLPKALLEEGGRVDGKICAEDLETLWNSASLTEMRTQLSSLTRDFETEYNAAVEETDHALVVSAFAAGIDRKKELGLNKQSFGVRALWGSQSFDHKVNFNWTRLDQPGKAPRGTTEQLVWESTRRLSAEEALTSPTVSVFGSWQRNRNIVGAKHRTVIEVGGGLSFKISDGVKVPVVLKWVNHRDLIEGASTVVGNVAVTIDLGDLKKKPKGD